MNIECEYIKKCRKADTDYCVSCEHNKFEDYYRGEEESQGDEDEYGEDYEDEEDEDIEIDELAKKIAKHEDFKNYNQNKNSVMGFIKKYFQEILDEWEDFAVEEIIDDALYYDKHPNERDEEIDRGDWKEFSEKEEERCARKIAEHPEFRKYLNNHTTREYFIKKFFNEMYNELKNRYANMYKICNLAKVIYDTEIKEKKK